MKHMLCVTTGLDVLPLLYAVSCQPGLWDQDTLRTQHPGSVHADVSDILLHFQPPGYQDYQGDEEHACQPRPAWWALPEARPLVFGLMARVQATRLGRVMITKLRPGGVIPPHTDSPSQTSYYLRHQITLVSPPECQFTVGDEQLALAPGTCWYVDNSQEHAVYNEGASDRIAVIVDVHVPTLPEKQEWLYRA